MLGLESRAQAEFPVMKIHPERPDMADTQTPVSPSDQKTCKSKLKDYRVVQRSRGEKACANSFCFLPDNPTDYGP